MKGKGDGWLNAEMKEDIEREKSARKKTSQIEMLSKNKEKRQTEYKKGKEVKKLIMQSKDNKILNLKKIM